MQLCPLEVEALAIPDQRFFSWFDPANFATIPYCINQLGDYISTEGPFDGVIGFSAGAALAAFYMIEMKRRDIGPPIKCAIFLSCAPSAAVQDYMNVQEADLISIPTANIWGTNDNVAPTGGEELRGMCDPVTQSVVTHDGGHEVPRKSHITEAAHAIRRTIYLGK